MSRDSEPNFIIRFSSMGTLCYLLLELGLVVLLVDLLRGMFTLGFQNIHPVMIVFTFIAASAVIGFSFVIIARFSFRIKVNATKIHIRDRNPFRKVRQIEFEQIDYLKKDIDNVRMKRIVQIIVNGAIFEVLDIRMLGCQEFLDLWNSNERRCIGSQEIRNHCNITVRYSNYKVVNEVITKVILFWVACIVIIYLTVIDILAGTTQNIAIMLAIALLFGLVGVFFLHRIYKQCGIKIEIHNQDIYCRKTLFVEIMHYTVDKIINVRVESPKNNLIQTAYISFPEDTVAINSNMQGYQELMDWLNIKSPHLFDEV